MGSVRWWAMETFYGVGLAYPHNCDDLYILSKFFSHNFIY